MYTCIGAWLRGGQKIKFWENCGGSGRALLNGQICAFVSLMFLPRRLSRYIYIYIYRRPGCLREPGGFGSQVFPGPGLGYTRVLAVQAVFLARLCHANTKHSSTYYRDLLPQSLEARYQSCFGAAALPTCFEGERRHFANHLQHLASLYDSLRKPPSTAFI